MGVTAGRDTLSTQEPQGGIPVLALGCSRSHCFTLIQALLHTVQALLHTTATASQVLLLHTDSDSDIQCMKRMHVKYVCYLKNKTIIT